MWDAFFILEPSGEVWFNDGGQYFFPKGGGMEKRRHPRMIIENFIVDISDGVGFFQGTVSDISRFGLCMTELPKRLNGGAKKMTVVISGKGANFKMNIRPRWYTQGGGTKSVGAEIINAPWGWTEFAMKFEPPLPKDIWDGIRL
jgi:PilZ domain